MITTRSVPHLARPDTATPRAVVYTAIFGGYDHLKPHPDHPGIDWWVCYTDNPTLACDGWDIRVEAGRFDHPRLSAKWWKCHPPPGFTASIWVDGSMNIGDSDFFDAIYPHSGDGTDMVMFPHPDRTSIIDEADVSTHMIKYAGLPVVEQAKHYIAEWGWADNKLWASTTIGRLHSPRVLQMGAAWFAENEHWTYQDQISLPPLVARYDIEVRPLPHSLWKNPWFRLAHHTSDL